MNVNEVVATELMKLQVKVIVKGEKTIQPNERRQQIAIINDNHSQQGMHIAAYKRL